MSKDQKPPKDRLLRIKYLAYKRSQYKSKGAQLTLEDFVQHAKFQLCRVNRVLMNDPVWDTYTQEEILIEFFSHQFSVSKDELAKFELALYGEEIDEFDKWADKEMQAEELKEAQKDRVSFNPTELDGEESGET